MAKQLVGPVERHIDKAILGITGVLVIYVVAAYLITPAHQIEIGGQWVAPEVINEQVAKHANSVRDLIRTKRPSEADDTDDPFEPLPGFVAAFELTNVPPERALPMGVAIHPDVPLVGPVKVIAGTAKLVEVVTLPQPVVEVGRSTWRFIETDGADIPVNWVTVSAVFDREEQMRRQREAYERGLDAVVIGDVQTQRRTQRRDGSWSDDDWRLVYGYSSMEPIDRPTISLVQKDEQITVPGGELAMLEKYMTSLRTPKVQLDLIRPLPPETMNGSSWKFPIITNHRDVVVMDDEYLFPDGEPNSDPQDRYEGIIEPEATVVADKTLTRAPTAREDATKSVAEAELLIQRSRRELAKDLAIEAYNILKRVIQSPNASPSDKDKARRLLEDAEQAERDIDREISKRRKRIQRGPSPRGGDGGLGRRVIASTQQLWVIDGRPEAVVGGETYQYRMRVLIHNRYAGQPSKLRNANDATVLLIPGEWSQATAPVTIEASNQYYITHAAPDRGTVSVGIFQWFEGVWVEDGPKLAIGDSVARRARHKVPMPDGSEGVDNPEIDFVADATIVDIDFARAHRERKKIAGGGLEFERTAATTSVVLVDSGGQLIERFLPVDKNARRAANVKKRVWKAPKKKRITRARKPKPGFSDFGP